MEYTKPIHEIDKCIRKAAIGIYCKVMTGEQYAKQFEKLDHSDPDIHEMADWFRSATGNDRYSCMMQAIESTGVRTPYGLYRSPVKNDSPEYVFGNGNVRRRGLKM